MYIDGNESDEREVGDVGFLVQEVDLDDGTSAMVLADRPARTIAGVRKLRGQCGGWWGVFVTAHGLARVTNVLKNDRMEIEQIQRGSDDEREALEELGWPELD